MKKFTKVCSMIIFIFTVLVGTYTLVVMGMTYMYAVSRIAGEKLEALKNRYRRKTFGGKDSRKD